MSKRLLTAQAVVRLRADPKKRLEIHDAGSQGLYLIIQPSGVKSWAMRFRRPNGKSAKLTLGPVDLTNKEPKDEPPVGAPLTLKSARSRAADLHRQRATGKDIVAVRHREQQERAARGAKTFAQAAMDFIEQHAMRETRHWQEQARVLGLRPASDEGGLEQIPGGLADRWGDRPIADIDGDDVHAIIDEAREKGVPGLERRRRGPNESRARALYSTLSMFLGWCVKQRRIKQSPCVGVSRPATPKARDRVLTDAELVKFWRAAEAEREEFAAVLKLLLLTGQRLGEVRGMRRAELGDGLTVWTIPSARTKNKRTHIVPLPPLAVDEIKKVGGTGEFVFTTDGAHPVGIGSKVKGRLDVAMKTAAWRLHDLRRTCVTGMCNIGVLPHVVEAVVNHVSGHKGGVAGTYNRSEYAPEKKAALRRWAAHVEALTKTGAKSAEVLPMRRRPKA